MEPSVITEVRLTSFKSFRDATLPLDDLTLVVGRNGSGKSNALDGLWVLSRLATGEDIRDALDGGRDGPAIRGGTAGCAPFGESVFSLGVSVRTGEELVDLDVTIQAEPVVQVVAEELRAGGRTLLSADRPRRDSGDIAALWDSSYPEPPRVRTTVDDPWKPLTFRNNRLLTTQVLSRVPATPAGQRVHRAADQVLAALKSVFVLDPVPDQMRQYVPRRDTLLRRNADNLSAAVASLLDHDTEARQSLLVALRRLNEQEVVDLTTTASALDDLMLTAMERFRGNVHQVPARVMSDGTLRFLAILVALAEAPSVDAQLAPGPDDVVGQTTVVIEELENGLHASQVKMLLEIIREYVGSRQVRVLATTQNATILDSVAGDEQEKVIVCQRDREGTSTLTRLVELSNFVAIAAKASLGDAAKADMLRSSAHVQRDPKSVLEEILGKALA